METTRGQNSIASSGNSAVPVTRFAFTPVPPMRNVYGSMDRISNIGGPDKGK